MAIMISHFLNLGSTALSFPSYLILPYPSSDSNRKPLAPSRRVSYRAQGGSRTLTPFDTGSWDQRGYLLRHSRKRSSPTVFETPCICQHVTICTQDTTPSASGSYTDNYTSMSTVCLCTSG